MNIISGKLKGKKLSSCNTKAVRPAMALVRKSIFDSLGNIENYDVLDLCAGTGCLGIEAISRGAKNLTLVDCDKNALKVIFKNLAICNIEATVISGQLPQILSKKRFSGNQYNLIFLDPPYGQKDFIEETLKALVSNKNLAENGRIIIETEKRCDFESPEQFKVEKIKRYGNTKVTYLCLTV